MIFILFSFRKIWFNVLSRSRWEAAQWKFNRRRVCKLISTTKSSRYIMWRSLKIQRSSQSTRLSTRTSWRARPWSWVMERRPRHPSSFRCPRWYPWTRSTPRSIMFHSNWLQLLWTELRSLRKFLIWHHRKSSGRSNRRAACCKSSRHPTSSLPRLPPTARWRFKHFHSSTSRLSSSAHRKLPTWHPWRFKSSSQRQRLWLRNRRRRTTFRRHPPRWSSHRRRRTRSARAPSRRPRPSGRAERSSSTASSARTSTRTPRSCWSIWKRSTPNSSRRRKRKLANLQFQWKLSRILRRSLRNL